MNLYIVFALGFLAAFILAAVFTLLIKRVAWRWQIVDRPEADPARKIHKKAVPLLGGLAIFFAFFVVVWFFAFCTDFLVGKNISLYNIFTLFIAGLFLMIGGILDDKYNLSPIKQLVWPVLAILTVIIGGIGVDKITNPLGGFLYFNQYQFTLLSWGGKVFKFVLIADIFTFFWLMLMIYTVKLLDGLDGLVAGIGAIGSIAIFLLSTATRWWQPETAILTIVLAGATAGFLLFNFYPAKIFLGESGLFIGFMLGVLSIISGGKIATALLVMGIPILDLVWVVARRLFWERKNPFKTSDRKHLHFRLLDVGLSQRQAVLILYLFSAFFGSLTLFLQSKDKLLALLILFGVMIFLGVFLILIYKRKNHFRI
ncbi:MAG: MraY family glycosyltransferase [Patescibacteria group bacterium]|jgi:UDP-GlcNAc:undecaprenyl-phosphate GlcNAc-1-phosphate transferase